MKKKLLFIAPDYYGFDEVILYGLNEYSDYEITMALSVSTKRYIYRNFGERLKNFFSKTFLNKNLKKTQKRRKFISEINTHDLYDIILVNRPDILDAEIYNLLNNKGGKKIVVLWDSLEKIQGQKESLKHYDIKYSFDAENCKEFGLKKINNFYFNEKLYNNNPMFDVIFLGTFDKRFNDLLRITQALKKDNINIHSFIYHHRDFIIKDEFQENITKLEKIIPFKESYKINEKGNFFLDLAHENQSGLSFRPFEAIGCRRKLITTNKNIKNYDFYDPENIFVIENIDDINIPLEFFTTPYKELPAKILQKYSFENWINNILDL
ncbi:lipopolysaccharide core biosynthesis protein rfaS [Chryseobacterium sp. C-71]|uniref:lipopolysaccharide core biosynthesis protein rfaS n=1 Tax=Chryseobacterium sp. C-71 TaxID=2893882 RepID=UPI001E4C1CD7|nr:lipopolysaccharide core biosynthesis protein rfaS [Chryseobacterium sp. C-71]UFH33817.1 lipopolysaccharide core biosynthesis protein rfaS [Chryseobacterium sp. C-71]